MNIHNVIHGRILATAFLALALPLAGCAKAVGESRLPDDPQSEPISSVTPAPAPAPDVNDEPTPHPQDVTQILAKYDYLDPKHEVPTKLLSAAVTYFAAHAASFANKNYLSVIDFSARSTLARFFIIDLKTGDVWAIHVAHGKNSDANFDGYATAFSNASGSEKSSLGVYKTAETYNGEHGLSLRLDGLSSTNSNVRSRAIVIHGASYVYEKAVVQGRSWGCPAVAMANRDEVIKRLKGGAMIYAGLSK